MLFSSRQLSESGVRSNFLKNIYFRAIQIHDKCKRHEKCHDIIFRESDVHHILNVCPNIVCLRCILKAFPLAAWLQRAACTRLPCAWAYTLSRVAAAASHLCLHLHVAAWLRLPRNCACTHALPRGCSCIALVLALTCIAAWLQ